MEHIMEHVSFISTRFSYRRDTKLFAEIEVIPLADSHYKFIIYPTKLLIDQEETLSTGTIDSTALSSPGFQIRESYHEQLDCLRAAIRYLSTLGYSRLSSQII